MSAGAAAALPPQLAMPLARLPALRRGQGAVAIEIEPVEPRQRPFAHLLAGHETLFAEHLLRMPSRPAMPAAAQAMTRAPLHPALGAALAALLEFGAAEAAVAIGVEPLEGAARSPFPALREGLARLLGGGPAVMVEVEPREALIGTLDRLLTGEIAVAIGARKVARLGRGAAGGGEQGRSGENSD